MHPRSMAQVSALHLKKGPQRPSWALEPFIGPPQLLHGQVGRVSPLRGPPASSKVPRGPSCAPHGPFKSFGQRPERSVTTMDASKHAPRNQGPNGEPMAPPQHFAALWILSQFFWRSFGTLLRALRSATWRSPALPQGSWGPIGYRTTPAG